jgi:predicted RND superfamily exporter protein
MIGTGTGSELRQPLGFAMVGGLLLSQLLTLFTTPVVYIYLDRINHWVTHLRSRSDKTEPIEGVPINLPTQP